MTGDENAEFDEWLDKANKAVDDTVAMSLDVEGMLDDVRSGLPMSTPAPRTPPRPRPDLTRYLCAAAHLDSGFADAAIKEYLVEPRRSNVSDTGVDSYAVLSEAVAARTRRKLRDSVLATLLVGFLLTAPPQLTLAWIAVGAVVALLRLVRRWVALSAVLGVLVVAGFLLSKMDLGGRMFVPGLAAIGLLVAMLVVLVADRLVVWRHVTHRFSRWSPPIVADLSLRRTIFQLAPHGIVRLLHRNVGRHDGPDEVPVTVYRGYSPFVGAGSLGTVSSVAVPLEPTPDSEPREMASDDLYNKVAGAVHDAARSLVMRQRVRDVETKSRVVVSAEELLGHMVEPESAHLIRDHESRPVRVISGAAADAIRTGASWWARSFQHISVETPGEGPVVSVFVHIAVDATTLYVECVPCVLMPVKSTYRSIDWMPRSPVRPVARALQGLVTLPISMPARLVHALTLFRAFRRDAYVPDQYGARHSLRELAAGTEFDRLSQRTDVDLIVKVVETQVWQVVRRSLRDAGYGTSALDNISVGVGVQSFSGGWA